MKAFVSAAAVALAVLWQASNGLSGTPSRLRLPKGRDIFFVENDLVSSRCLDLSHDGTYRQIDQDRTTSTEVDRGTWEQATDDTVLLHSTGRGLRFRALLAGPLTVVLDSPGKIAALPEVAAAIRRLLENWKDVVFTAKTAAELNSPPALVSVDRQAETIRREDLLSLALQIDNTVQTEQTRTYVLMPVRVVNRPLLLVLRDAVFGPEQISSVYRDYGVPHGAAPPFYFAQTDARTFASQVGRYREFQFPGGLSNP